MSLQDVSSAGTLTGSTTESSSIAPESKGESSGFALSIISAPGGELTIDSRAVARAIKIQHDNLLATIDAHRATIEAEFGHLLFETGTVRNSVGAVNRTRFALLTEDQAVFIGTLSRNSAAVVRFKAQLVKAFKAARERGATPAQVAQAPALPADYEEALAALLLQVRETKRIEAEKAVLALQVKTEAPMVAFYHAVALSPDTVSLNEAAKLLKLGRNKMMARLRADRILTPANLPYQQFLDRKLFVVVESKWKRGEDTGITLTTRCMQRGVEFLRRHFLKPMQLELMPPAKAKIVRPAKAKKLFAVMQAAIEAVPAKEPANG